MYEALVCLWRWCGLHRGPRHARMPLACDGCTWGGNELLWRWFAGGIKCVCVYYGMFTTVRRAGVELCVDVSTRQRQAADVGLWVASHQCWDGVWCLTALAHSLTPHSSLSHTLAAAAAVVCRSLCSIDHTRVSLSPLSYVPVPLGVQLILACFSPLL